MSRITQKGAVSPLPVLATSTDSSLATLLGSRFDLSDGREVVLVQAEAATTIASGKLYQSPATVANHQNIAVTAFSAASSSGPATVTVTLGATAATANQYAGGFVVVNSANGAGQTIRIASHPAAGSGASLVITLEDNPVTALTTSSKVCLIANPANGVIINPTTPTGIPVGVALYAIAASSYGFLVCKGATAALSDATAPAVGTAIAASVATAGAIGSVPYATNIVTGTVIGNTLQSAVSTEYRTVFINL